MKFVKNSMATALLTTALTAGTAFAADFHDQDNDANEASHNPHLTTGTATAGALPEQDTALAELPEQDTAPASGTASVADPSDQGDDDDEVSNNQPLIAGTAVTADYFSNQENDAIDSDNNCGMERWGVKRIFKEDNEKFIEIVFNRDILAALNHSSFNQEKGKDSKTKNAKGSLAALANWILDAKGVKIPNDLHKIEVGSVTLQLRLESVVFAKFNVKNKDAMDTLVVPALVNIRAKATTAETHPARPALDAYRTYGELFVNSTRLARLKDILDEHDSASDDHGKLAALDNLAEVTVKKARIGSDAEKATDVIIAKASLFEFPANIKYYEKAKKYKQELVIAQENTKLKDELNAKLEYELQKQNETINNLKAAVDAAENAKKGSLSPEDVAVLVDVMQLTEEADVNLNAMKAVVEKGLAARAEVANLKSIVATLRKDARPGVPVGLPLLRKAPEQAASSPRSTHTTSADLTHGTVVAGRSLNAEEWKEFIQMAEKDGWTHTGNKTFKKGLRVIGADHVASEIFGKASSK